MSSGRKVVHRGLKRDISDECHDPALIWWMAPPEREKTAKAFITGKPQPFFWPLG
jgi:hypothetical protein